jgi:hypothetical protein
VPDLLAGVIIPRVDKRDRRTFLEWGCVFLAALLPWLIGVWLAFG